MNVNSVTSIYNLSTVVKSSDTSVFNAMSEQTDLFEIVDQLANDIDTVSVDKSQNSTAEDKVNNSLKEIEGLTQEYNDLKAEIETLQQVIAEAKAKKQAAQKEIARLSLELSQNQILLNAELADKQANMEARSREVAEKVSNEQSLSSENMKNKSLASQLEETRASYEAIMEKIETTRENFEKDQAAKREEIIAQCQSDYDEEKDGDYNSYVQQRLASEMGSDSCDVEINGLQSQGESISSSISSIESAISDSNSKINSLKSDISQNASNIAGYDSAISKNKSNISKFNSNIIDLNNKIADQKTIIENSDTIIEYANATIEENSARMDEIENKENPQKVKDIKGLVLSDISQEEMTDIVNNAGVDFAQTESKGLSALKFLAGKENLIGRDDTVLDKNDMNALNKKYGISFVA